MAFTMLANRAAGTQAAPRCLGGRVAKSPLVVIPVRRVACRAEGDNKPAPTKDSKDKKPAKSSGANRDPKNLYVPVASQASLQYLDGTLPGDFGFDPLGLLDPSNSGGLITPEWLTYSEVIHCRWAMLGAAGMIAPEILAKAGITPTVTGGPWYEQGVIGPAGTYEGYWTDNYSLFYIEIIAMQFAELRRLQDFRKPGSMGKQYFLGLEAALGGSGNPSYPGGPLFNFFNLGKDEAKLNKYKANELRNGRLAMLAVFGYGAQATLTKVGPLQNLLDHLADPVHNNILTNFGKSFTGVGEH